MKKNKKWIQLLIFGFVLVIGAFTVFSNLKSETVKPPKVGDKAIDFTLQGLDGQTYQFSDIQKGKVIVMNYWGTFCPPCKAEMPALQRQQDKWKDKDVLILGMNMDNSRVTAQQFLDELNLNLFSLHDEKDVVRKQYGVKDYPTTFFIGRDGKIKEIRVGEMDEPYIDRMISQIVQGG
ncbi:redoxin domain-containing protein [Paenibacillus sp. N1-5-1-14]|uniref:redoxin domain-containing protein n=1 Tax=Paenibacillus radicibacter TaxID=2972488 RepID=UPI002159A778|nr:redoxin domain-containing protein [Paenibacillus radicibacter]MCR8642335.1 redoxin domain-containing protein [Paenibacillus radicibacter]